MKTKFTRRQFLQTSAKGALVIGTGGSHILIQGCSEGRKYDIIIAGGIVFDGLGNPGKEADIAIKEDRIVLIGENLNRDNAAKIIEADGMAVSPGFIDVHTHTDVGLITNPLAESHIRQGITTEISGNCGSTPFPVAEEISGEMKKRLKEEFDVDLNWTDINGFFQRLDEQGIALNYVTFLGQGDLRGKVVGFDDQPATAEQIVQMKIILEENMKAGAWGISTGLEYAPGSYATTEEVIELCRLVAANNGIYATHMRDEGDMLIEAIDETLRIARETGVSTQVSHFKIGYPRNWHKVDAALEKVEKARDEGIQIMADRYPYIAGSTGLSLYFPLWARQGTTKDFIARLKDPTLEEKFRSHYREQEQKLGSWEKVRICSISTDKNKHLEGKNIIEAAGEADKDPYDFMRDLLIEEENQVGMITFMMKEENLQRILAHPLVTVGSDGSAVAPYGVLHKGKPHPRFYGTFPRILGKYVREEKIMTLPQALQKMTSMPADKFGFRGRGRISEGYFADLVIFDPDRIIDRATWEDPHRYPDGIGYVIVNGEVVVQEGETTGKLPGRILKKEPSVSV
ncbi:MAG: D-aminoacylase [Bacteroidales bacterium]|nr:MAG: D-aminoacylase [Bacteroidales bacterium]